VRRGTGRDGEERRGSLSLHVGKRVTIPSAKARARAKKRARRQIARVSSVDDCPRSGDSCGRIKINYARWERGEGRDDEKKNE